MINDVLRSLPNDLGINQIGLAAPKVALA